MNRFEAMLAPPTLGYKELWVHIRMQTAISLDEAKNYITEMLVPEVRLYDELTTLRFRKPGPEEDNTAYREMCRALSGASGTPIPYRFFKTEFDRLMEDLNIAEGSGKDAESFSADKLKSAVDALKDPWRIQAYAALCARIAEASETEDAGNAAEAWDRAFVLYGRFFDMAKVEESTTYKLQTEEKLRQETASAWDGFLKKLSDGIVNRLDPHINALSTANSLNEAAQLYDNIPPLLKEKDVRQKCVRAMLACMSKEVDRLLKSGESVSALLTWMDKLDVADLHNSGSPLVKKAADDFYDSCAVYIREVINEDKHDLAVFADMLAAKFPDDVEIAKAGGGKSLYRKDVIGICTREMIISKYESRIKSVSSESDAESLGREIYRVINSVSVSGNAKNEFLGKVMQAVIVLLFKNKMDPRYLLKFLECYEDSMPVDDPNFKTVGDCKRKLEDLLNVPEYLKALKDFAEADNGTYDQLSALRRVINWALEDPNREINDEKYIQLTDRLCVNAIIGCLNEKDSVSDYRFESDYKPVMSLAASFLPSGYKFPSGGKGKIRMSTLERLLGLDIDRNLRVRADNARKKAGLNSLPERVNPFNTIHERIKNSATWIRQFLEVIGITIKTSAVPIILFVILSLILCLRGSLPTALAYLRLLSQIFSVLSLMIGLALGCLRNIESHKGLWFCILMLAVLAIFPVTFYMSLGFFNALPMKLWAIIIYVIYGIFCLPVTYIGVALLITVKKERNLLCPF